MNYIMSDLHGKYDKFIKMLELIQFNDNDTLYILGDVVDRGEYPIKLVQYIMKSKNIKMCLGNHEDMMINSYYEGITKNNLDYALGYIHGINLYIKDFNITNWINNGGEITARQFIKLPLNEQKEIIDFFEKLPLFFEYKNYIFSHAGMDLNYLKDKKDIKWNDVKHFQTKDDFIWSRKNFFEFKGLSDKLIVFGHTPGLNRDFSIWMDPMYKDKICVDCGAAYGGKLGCFCLDNNKTYYV